MVLISRHSKLVLSILFAFSGGPFSAHAQPVGPVAVPAVKAPPRAAPVASDKAMAQLFENVAFWSQRGQPTIAVQELERVIALSPPDANTLALAARLNFQLDRFDAGEAYRLRLRQLAPNDPRLASLAAEQKRSPEGLRMLAEARKLSGLGRKEEAVQAYAAFTKGKVPDSLAIEYYLMLGTSSPEGFEVASKELPLVAARWPGDASFRLAYAQLLTFQDASRSAGIDQLRELTHVPIVAAGARVAWHDALLWQGADINTRDQIDVYLKENPTDPVLEAKRKEIQDSLPDEGLLDRMRAYEDGAAGRAEESEKGFLAALAYDPKDAESMIMLSIIRRKQKRLAESDKLIANAMEVAPDRHDEFVDTIGFDPKKLAMEQSAAGANMGASAKEIAAANAAIMAKYAKIQSLAHEQKYDEAEKLLQSVVGKTWRSADYLTLGFIQKGAGRLPDAEKSFRQALKADTKNADAMVALADVLAQSGTRDEIDGLYGRAREVYGKARNNAAVQAINRVQSEHLRGKAEFAEDQAVKLQMLRAALKIDPSNAWLRLDLARVLQTREATGEATQMMAQGVSGDRPSNDALLAAIIFAEQTENLPEADRLIARLPAADRTADMQEIQRRSAARAEVQQAVKNANAAAVRSALITMAGRPDPTGAWGNEIGRALIKRGDKSAVPDAVSAGFSSTAQPTVQQRLSYAGILLAAEQRDDATRMLDGLDQQNLSAAQQGSFEQLLNGIALQSAYQLSQRRQGKAAVASLKPRLAVEPRNVDLNLALSRVYQANGNTDQAVVIANGLLNENPNNLDIRLAAIDAAVSSGDSARAGILVADGLEKFPDEAQLYMRSGYLERARGNNARALADFKHASSLRQNQVKAHQDAR